MREIVKTSLLNCIQRRNITRHVNNIQVFEQAFSTIKSITGIGDIKEIVKIFVKLEERNFSLLRYTNQLSREIENIYGNSKMLVCDDITRRNIEDDFQKCRHEAVAGVAEGLDHNKRFTEQMESAAVSNLVLFEEILPYLMHMVEIIDTIQAFDDTDSASYRKPVGGFSHATVLRWLDWFERIFLLYRDYLPSNAAIGSPKPFSYTAGPMIKSLIPKKPVSTGNAGLLRLADVPSSERCEDDEDDHVLSLEEVKQKVVGQIARNQKKKAITHALVPSVVEQSLLSTMQSVPKDLKPKLEEELESSVVSDEYSDDDVEPDDQELEKIFLKRYKMSRTDLKDMADRMGILLSNLCYLKQEFDAYDADQSGFIDASELQELLKKLGEDLSETELQQAFRDLDADHSGEIEFFEFVQWFTSDD